MVTLSTGCQILGCRFTDTSGPVRGLFSLDSYPGTFTRLPSSQREGQAMAREWRVFLVLEARIPRTAQLSGRWKDQFKGQASAIYKNYLIIPGSD